MGDLRLLGGGQSIVLEARDRSRSISLVHMEAFLKVDVVAELDDSGGCGGGCGGGDQPHLYQQLELPLRNWRR
ncbi:hypothetical protein COP2_028847 [Malus domestica]